MTKEEFIQSIRAEHIRRCELQLSPASGCAVFNAESQKIFNTIVMESLFTICQITEADRKRSQELFELAGEAMQALDAEIKGTDEGVLALAEYIAKDVNQLEDRIEALEEPEAPGVEIIVQPSRQGFGTPIVINNGSARLDAALTGRTLPGVRR